MGIFEIVVVVLTKDVCWNGRSKVATVFFFVRAVNENEKEK